MTASLRIIFISLIAINLLGEPVSASAKFKFYVLVNTENDISLAENETLILLNRLYLKKSTEFPGGKKALFFARRKDSLEEIAFRKTILKLKQSQLEDHWLKMKQTRGLTPPRGIGSTRILLRQLKSRPEAIGVLSEKDYRKHAQDLSDVKILLTFMVTNDE